MEDTREDTINSSNIEENTGYISDEDSNPNSDIDGEDVLLPLDEFNLDVGNIEPYRFEPSADSDETEWERDSLEDDSGDNDEQERR